MVETGKRNSRVTPTFHIIAIGLLSAALLHKSGCSNQTPDTTVITLQHIPALQAAEAVQPLIADDVQYKIAENKVIFYAPKDEIEPVIQVLEELDRPKDGYLIEFRKVRTGSAGKRYTTENSGLVLDSIKLTEGVEASLEEQSTLFYPFFDSPITEVKSRVIIKLLNETPYSSRLFIQLEKGDAARHQSLSTQMVVTHEQWQALSPSKQKSSTYSTSSKPLDLEIRVTPTSN